jgi:hypothetical protein
MDDTSTSTATLDQADEEILTYTVSDEALEAAAGTEQRRERGAAPYTFQSTYCLPADCR